MYGSEIYDIILPDRAADTTKGASNIDFNFEPPLLYYDSTRLLDFSSTNSSVCNSVGELLAYTNGQVIYNQFHKAIADTINYSPDWEYSNAGDNEMAIPYGLLTSQGAIILPMPGNDQYYYAIYTTVNREYNDIYLKHIRISYTLFGVSDDDKEGALLLKDSLILADTLSGSITAIRHGNGRDWWILAPRFTGNQLNIWLLDPGGFHYEGVLSVDYPDNKGIGQIYGSPDGNWLSWFSAEAFTETGGQLFLCQFDRCSGTISNPEFTYVDLSNYRLGFGVSFSNDSRYFYMCNSDFIYQYDLWEENVLNSEQKVATYDGYEYFFPWDTIQPLGRRVNFHAMGLGPDGRIYISPSSAGTRMMSVMHFPEKGGESCDVRQHSLLMPTGFHRGIPNFPNYRLGPLDNSYCDTLGLDNFPISKFRYEVDSSDHLSVYFSDQSYYHPESLLWNFGDGSEEAEERYPTHQYAENGVYEVCLTVENENGKDTTCKTVTIGSTSVSDEVLSTIAEVHLFPNPCQNYFQLTLGNYIPEYGRIEVYNSVGSLVLSDRVFYGNNIYEAMTLAKGTYYAVVKDGAQILKTLIFAKY